MEKILFKTSQTHLDGDFYTPTQLYVKLRDRFPNALLFESSEYNSATNSFSFICLRPVLEFKAEGAKVAIRYPEGDSQKSNLAYDQVLQAFAELAKRVQVEGDPLEKVNGFFGYTNYSAVQYFDSIRLQQRHGAHSIPDFLYSFYQNILVFNHYNNRITLIENLHASQDSQNDLILNCIKGEIQPTFPFLTEGERTSNLSDEQFISHVNRGIEHCLRGDVFQIVLSRQFMQSYRGDEFALYRKLRTINPSPYLFFFDYGSFQLMGSSPEAQLIVQDGLAEIHPIAGTYKRTGNDTADAQAAKELAADPKENQEHTMLVDLARNDLSRRGRAVRIDKLKEVQFFSHVIHLVSRVIAQVIPEEALQLFADTFPAGTLSGAPKFRAMELIDEIENQSRGIYGGAIGFIGLNGNINTAIVIRTFLCKANTVYAQAGAGVVSKSDPQKELEEVNNKLNALMRALEKVQEI